jgi:hypothetical protein
VRTNRSTLLARCCGIFAHARINGTVNSDLSTMTRISIGHD